MVLGLVVLFAAGTGIRKILKKNYAVPRDQVYRVPQAQVNTVMQIQYLQY